MLMRSYPILSRLLIWIFVPIILVCGIGYGFLLQSLPQTEGTIYLKGLGAPVQIVRDEHAIPHISAESDNDAFFALGYLHAQDRLWQMNYNRRLAQGRLSEIMGRGSLDSDKFMRTLGFARAAQADLQSLDESALQALTSYANGVNAWINEGNVLPVEFYILDTKPEVWHPSDSLLMSKWMAFNLGRNNLNMEVSLDLLIKEMGIAKALEMFPDVNAKAFSVTEVTGLVDEEIQQGLLAQSNRLQDRFDIGDKGLGSNAWAVSGQFTQSGLPLLGSDPHLAVQIPTMFYLAAIQGDRLNVTGATFPGIPVVLAGRNESIAWGTTNMIADVQDIYVERTNPLNDDQYEIDGQWMDMEIDEELIYIKSDFPSFLTNPIAPIKWQVRRTRNGPLISDAIGRVERPLALRWTGFDEADKSYQSFLGINYAVDWTSFKSAFKDYAVPASNFIYADVHGDIGLFGAGKIPIRSHSNGRLPVPGWQSIYDWEGYIPLDSVPQILNPEKGYVANSNNKNHPDDYPYMVSHLWAAPYRVDSIRQTLESHIKKGEKLTVQDFVNLQGSTDSLQVGELLGFIQNMTPRNSKQEGAINKLKEWSGSLSTDSTEAVIYLVWVKHFRGLLIADDLKGNALQEERSNRLQFLTGLRNPKFIKSVIEQGEDLQFKWCDLIDTEVQESCEDLGLMALDETLKEIDRKIGADKPWGDVLKVHYGHQAFTNTQLLDLVFDRDIGKGGDRYSVNSVNWAYAEDTGYRVSTTANFRQVVDLNDWEQGGFIIDTGQSGNVLSQHYDDNIVPFKALTLWPWRIKAEQGARKESTLILEPIKHSSGKKES
ncbi:penicillin acylase family protein [Paraneptunicella aestuarii]|uniref:penicillin acylase family protein n=1 Tax=Paraneptunicella aestuarii TaxID=2831148 RepID=UPI001E48C19E|nr:penicillin acylase family protein [Paraneptunicella aestuarii]UAA39453.1 penicillin acylase family protein [Paraneptunicella aestuarii]